MLSPPRLQLISGSASPEEAAAIVAAIERFMRDTAPAGLPSAAAEHEAWRAVALLEGVTRELDETGPGIAHPWMGGA